MNNNGKPKLERLVGARLLGGFQKMARTVMRTSGHPLAFGLAIGIIVIWALTGPLYRFSNTWLLVLDTIANGITFLMIFLIRNAQNRESEAVQLKLDELIRATKTARNTLLEFFGNWNIIKGKIKQKWATLTDDDLQFVEGKQDELIGRIQKRTGEAREAVERALHESRT